jgi:hypothetical protein
MTDNKTAGQVLVEKILADLKEEGIVPDSREAELLDHARDMADRIEELKGLVAEHGSTIVDKLGNVRPSPLLSEIRQSTIVLTRCLNGVQMYSEENMPKDHRKQKAGAASWAARQGRATGAR